MGKIRVEVRYLPGVEDPEAITISRNLQILGYDSVGSVSVSKVYQFEIGNRENGMKQVNEVARKLLCNEVIQEYDIKEE
jgi:phosphoribosylformylglycinamidine synthase